MHAPLLLLRYDRKRRIRINKKLLSQVFSGVRTNFLRRMTRKVKTNPPFRFYLTDGASFLRLDKNSE